MVPALDQAKQVLAMLQFLAMMNVGQFGTLATLTSLPQAQTAVQAINAPDLIAVTNALQSPDMVYSAAGDSLLTNIVGFVEVVETLGPQVSNIKAVTSYIILEQLGLTAVQSVVSAAPSVGSP